MFRWRDVIAGFAALALAGCSTGRKSEIVDETFAEAAGVTTHIKEWGSSDKRPVLLIHGAASNLYVFEPTIVPLLEGDNHLVAYDRPGMGLSPDRPSNAQELGEQARVAAGVIEAMKLDRPIVVGHSYGGAVALRLALDYPDAISGLVLMGPAAYDWPGGVGWHYHASAMPVLGPLFNRLISRPFVASASKMGLEGAFAPLSPPDGYYEQTRVPLAVRPAALGANGKDMVAVRQELIAQMDRYAEIKMPVAILTGDSDDVVSPELHSRRLDKVIANTRLEVLEGVGHVPHEASPEVFKALFEWVASQASIQASRATTPKSAVTGD